MAITGLNMRTGNLKKKKMLDYNVERTNAVSQASLSGGIRGGNEWENSPNFKKSTQYDRTKTPAYIAAKARFDMETRPKNKMVMVKVPKKKKATFRSTNSSHQ